MAANKPATLVSRSELRDLVDLKLLLEAGQPLDRVLLDAAQKDGSADAATVAWTLDHLRIGAQARLPGGTDPVELERFRQDLIVRLRRAARADAGP